MTFQSPLVARERILLYGEPSTGKSNAVVSIAKLNKITHTDSTIYIIDNDRSYDMTTEQLDLPIVVYNVYEWMEYIDTLKTILPKLRSNDWLVCDLISECWPSVQEFYTNQVFGQDIGSYFLQVKQDLNKDTEFGGWTDWKYINKLYFDFVRPFVYKSPCHILGCATADPIQRPKGGSGKAAAGDDKETVSVFGQVGFKPDGQKRLKHQFNTTIFLHKSLRGEYLMTSVKDRERVLQISTPLNNFAIDYLKGVAQWTIS